MIMHLWGLSFERLLVRGLANAILEAIQILAMRFYSGVNFALPYKQIMKLCSITTYVSFKRRLLSFQIQDTFFDFLNLIL
jgi:hypothetical protein